MGDITFLSKQTIEMLTSLRERFEQAGGFLALANPRDVVKNLISLRRSQSGVDFFHTTLEAEAHIIEEFGDVDFVYVKDVVDFQLSLARHNKDCDIKRKPVKADSGLSDSEPVSQKLEVSINEEPVFNVEKSPEGFPDDDLEPSDKADFESSNNDDLEPSDKADFQLSNNDDLELSDKAVFQSSDDNDDSQLSDEENSLMALSELADREQAIEKAGNLSNPLLREAIDREIILESSLCADSEHDDFSYDNAVSSVIPRPLFHDPFSPDELATSSDELPKLKIETSCDDSFAVDIDDDSLKASSVHCVESDCDDDIVEDCKDPGKDDEPIDEDAESLALGTYALLQEDNDMLQSFGAFQQGKLLTGEEESVVGDYEQVSDDILEDSRSQYDELSLDEDCCSLLALSDSELSHIVKTHEASKEASFDFILEPDPLSDTGKNQKIVSISDKAVENSNMFMEGPSMGPVKISLEDNLFVDDSADSPIDSCSSIGGDPTGDKIEPVSSYEIDIRQAIQELKEAPVVKSVVKTVLQSGFNSSTTPDLLIKEQFPSKGRLSDFKLTKDSRPLSSDSRPLSSPVISDNEDDFETLCIEIKSENPKKRWHAARALGRLEDTRGIAVLEKLLKAERDFIFIKDMARLSLARLNKLYNPMY
jgi:hypothetical protein